MRIVVFGSDGQLGSELVDAARRSGVEVAPFSHRDVDITRHSDVAMAVESVPKLTAVVNAAAYTHVDRAEAEPDKALSVNRDGAGHVAAAAMALGVPVVHFSTDYVFDGSLGRPYREDDSPRPINVYGQSKLAGEIRVAKTNPLYMIFRTSWLFGRQGTNFVKTMLDLLQSQEAVSVVNDQLGTPTSAADLARDVVSLLKSGMVGEGVAQGVFHYAGEPATTWYSLARCIAGELSRIGGERPCVVRQVSSASLGFAARRPTDSRLDCSRMSLVLGLQRPRWRDSLHSLVRALLRDRRDD